MSERAQVIEAARRFLQQQVDAGEEEVVLCRAPSQPARTSLRAFQDAICRCTRCPLSAKRKHFVFGEGDNHAGVMFIGEAPGAEEDQQGRPFVGAAGRLLTRIIEAMGLTRDEVYIANVLKCRPPNNRDPSPEEVEACEPYLLQQIEMIQPKVICTLGRIAAQALLRTAAPLSGLRGRVHAYGGIRLLATYHPAALLRNPKLKSATWDDVRLLRKEYDGVELPRTKAPSRAG